jgi:undecaprenyl-diphosphatase
MIKALLLGVIQGITEFLPVSSSGHLVLAQLILPGFKTPGTMFEVVLHGGSLLAVIIYFRNELLWFLKGLFSKLPAKENADARSWVLGILIATVPVGVVGVMGETAIETLFDNPLAVSIALCCTGVILFLGEWFQTFRKNVPNDSDTIRVAIALCIGLAQSVALIPGISRSGITMAAGLAAGWTRPKTARFSFLLMLPAITGALILKAGDIPNMISAGYVDLSALTAGFASAFAASYLAIACLMKIVQRYSFKPFAIYCLSIGTVSIVLQLFIR